MGIYPKIKKNTLYTNLYTGKKVIIPANKKPKGIYICSLIVLYKCTFSFLSTTEIVHILENIKKHTLYILSILGIILRDSF